MRKIKRAVLPAIAVSAAVLGLAACADTYGDYGYGYGYGYPYDYGYGYGPYYSGYYGDCFGGYYDASCGYPVFGGTVFIGGHSYRGLHYRDGDHGREFWNGHGWRRPDTGAFRGSVTAQARPAPRVTPVPRALGRSRVATAGNRADRRSRR